MLVKLRSALGLALGCLLLVSACGRSGFSYVEQKDEGVFIKVPDHWSVFETTEIEPPPQLLGDLLLQPLSGVVEPWQVVIDGGPTPTASNIREPLYSWPIGLAEIQPIDFGVRDLFNTSMMRSLSTGFIADPVNEVANGNTEYIVELDQDIVQDDLRGNRLRYKRAVEGGIIVVDSLVLADGVNSKWYRITMSCEENCYLANAALIEDIMTSFTVEN
jgi:hypothetical protein